MKLLQQIIKSIFTSATVFTICLNVNAQNKFEGKIVSAIEIPNLTKEMEMFKSLMPTESTTYIKGDKSLNVQKSSMSDIKIYTNSVSKTVNMYSDMMGNKIAIKKNYAQDEKNKPTLDNFDLQSTNETKTISGYKCTKYIIKAKKEDKNSFTTEVWVTTEIISNANIIGESWVEKIKGFPMEYEINQDSFKLRITTKTIEKTPVEDSLFIEPTDYKETNLEELMNKGE